MGFKSFWKESAVTFILRKILYAALLGVLIIWLVLMSIDKYTRHGESISVPDLNGLYIEEAGKLLQKNDLFYEVIDSVYDRTKPLATILEQIPSAGSVVKKNRAIFLIVNKRQIKQVPLPEVNDLSYRQANALLNSIGLNVSSVINRPSEYRDLVIDVLIDSTSIAAGTKLNEGTSVTLVVGSGLGTETAEVPTLTGLSLEEGRKLALSSSFVIGAKNSDEVSSLNKPQYIFKQDPKPGTSHPEGTRIDLWLTDDPSLIENPENAAGNNEEEFF